jgi:hypothetical protein
MNRRVPIALLAMGLVFAEPSQGAMTANSGTAPGSWTLVDELFSGSCSFADRAAAVRKAEPLLQEGDLIFIEISNVIFRHLAETTGSWESHVGILFRDAKGRWIVAESKPPLSKFTPLKSFVMHPWHGRFMIRRVRGGLSHEEKQRLLAATEARMGQWYQLGFNYDSKHLYCSKLVHDAYREAVGTEVGKVETFRDLLTANPHVPLGFWKVWFFNRIPWDRRCITTTSELKAPNFVTVFDSSSTRPR